MKRFRRLAQISVAAVGVVSLAASANSRLRLSTDPQSELAIRLVGAHNQIRTAEALRLAEWDVNLAASADSYAKKLAESDKFAHSPAEMRLREGENLWRGTLGAFTLERMVSDWGSEKRMFRPGRFPNVSTTGRWEDVGHYTQIIWPTTLRVGCAVRASANYEYLVCRYSSSGNVFGEAVGSISLVAR